MREAPQARLDGSRTLLTYSVDAPRRRGDVVDDDARRQRLRDEEEEADHHCCLGCPSLRFGSKVHHPCSRSTKIHQCR